MSATVDALGVTAAAAKYAAGLRPGDVHPKTIDRTKQALLDLLGIAIRAKFDADSSAPIARSIFELSGRGTIRAIGHEERYPAHYAAFLNAAYAHTLDFDDTHESGSIHPGAPVIPAVLAVAEERGRSGAVTIAAIVAGYDLTVRLSQALNPTAVYARGFHPTAICGTFGAAAAVANVNGDDAELIENALGLAGSFAAGGQQFLDTGGWNKRVQVGYAAHNAIVAYRLAAKGVFGSRDAFEGRLGVFANYSGDADAGKLVDGLGERHAIDETATKPYPCCRYAHAPLDALIEILDDADLKPEEIERVQIRIPSVPIKLIAEPAERRRNARSVVEGQFSMYFLAAAAALRRRFAWSDYALLDSEPVRALVGRIDVVADEDLDRGPSRMSGIVEIHARGRSWKKRCDVPSGEPQRALGWDALIEKFHDLAKIAYDENRRASIINAVRTLDEAKDLQELSSLLGAP